MYFIHDILTNMFRPLLQPSSGYCYDYKNKKVQMRLAEWPSLHTHLLHGAQSFLRS